MKQALISEDDVVHLCAGRPRYFPHNILCRATGREVIQVATDVQTRQPLYDFYRLPDGEPLVAIYRAADLSDDPNPQC